MELQTLILVKTWRKMSARITRYPEKNKALFPRATEASILQLQEYGVFYFPGVLSSLTSLLEIFNLEFVPCKLSIHCGQAIQLCRLWQISSFAFICCQVLLGGGGGWKVEQQRFSREMAKIADINTWELNCKVVVGDKLLSKLQTARARKSCVKEGDFGKN